MDKYEYKLRSEEIKTLIAERDFVKAVEVADTIDWTRVRSVSMLCTISDLYKINRRYKEAKELLTQAYERYPSGRTILYSLCELCIKTDDTVRAIEYYKEFVQLAPTDNGKFILQYKIYEAQDVSLEERIAVLEELKKRDYREKWGYELAYLYHRIGLGTKCVEECDELILWFREGRYVKKAMELKMLHQQLTGDQETLYKRMLPENEKKQYEEQTRVYESSEIQAAIQNDLAQTKVMESPEEFDIKVKTVDVSKYNTINLQKELAESMKEVLVADNNFAPLYNDEEEEEEIPAVPVEVVEEEEVITEEVVDEPVVLHTVNEEVSETTEKVEVKECQAEGMVELTSSKEYVPGSVTEAIMAPMLEGLELDQEDDDVEENVNQPLTIDGSATEEAVVENRPSIREVMNGKADAEPVSVDMSKVDPPEKYGRLLSQEYDGQISLVVPETEKIEKQITGQMSLEDILAEWEKTKKENEAKRKRETTERVLAQTGTMFTAFEAKIRDGILEKLEKGEIDIASIKDENSTVVADEMKEILSRATSIKSVQEESVEDDTVEEIEEIVDSEIEVEDPVKIEESTTEEVVELETVEEESDLPEVEEIAEIEEADVTEEESVEERDVEMVTSEEELIEEEVSEEELPQQISSDEEKAEKSENEDVSIADDEVTRTMSEEEIELFAPFVQTKNARIRLIKSLDMISLASYTGNVFVTGETQEEAVELAKNVIREVQLTDRNFSGKVAKVTGVSLNNRDVDAMVSRLNNGALIIEKASGMEAQTVKDLLRALNQEKTGIVVVLQDNKKARNKMMEYFSNMKDVFNVHIEVEELGDEALVAYGKKYARHLEYSIDEMGVLALHTRIDRMQTADHVVTVADVRDIIDEAIESASRKSFKHFTEVLFAKRYDDDDMIILRERDFLE